jgi:Uma2 family endonuclease
MGMLLKDAPVEREEQRNGQHLLLNGRTWEEYEKLRDLLSDRTIRVTFDRGDLEVMVLSYEHDRYSRIFGLLVFTLARFFRKKIATAGSFTIKRKDLERGLEPDNSFYIANWPLIKGKRRLDLNGDPPPDLAIEGDITHSALDRMSIYAALGISEVWVFDGDTLKIHVLAKGKYKVSKNSPTFPEAPVADMVQFFELSLHEDDVTMVEAVEKWLDSLPRTKNGQRKGK